MDENEFKMTYYKGAMLAQGGNLIVRADAVVFAPGTIERAVGAEDTVVPYEKIKMVEITGTITESLMVRTQEKAHRFVGSELYKIRDKIDAAIQSAYASRPAAALAQAPAAAPAPPKVMAAPSQAAPKDREGFSGQCSSCFKNLNAAYNYCPFCKTVVKKSCPECFRGLEAAWKFCPNCSQAVQA